MGGSVARPVWAGWIDRSGWLIVAAAGFLAYSNCFDGQLFLDDVGIIGGLGPQVADPNALVPHPLRQRWLGTWSLLAGAVAFGSTRPAVHAVNVAIHLTSGIVLWAVVARTLRLPRFADRFADRAGLLATAVAGLWVVHPLTTQAVTYLCQRYESQMGLFVLVSVWCSMRGAAAARGRAGWYMLSVLAAYAASSTKEPAVVVPFVIAAYDRLFLADSWREVVRKRWALYLGLFVVQATLVPIGLWERATATAAPEPLVFSGAEGLLQNKPQFVSAGFSATGLTPWMYFRSQAGVILHYLRLAVFPDPLVLDYGWPVATEWWQIWPPGAVVVILLVATGWAAARGAAGSFLGVWFFAFLAVSSSIIPIVDLAFEHRMYLPLAAVVAAAVLGADRALAWAAARTGWRADRLKIGTAVVVGIALTALTHARNDDYRDLFRMYRKTLAAAPENDRVWNNLGFEYLEREQFAEAAASFREALRHPNALTPFINEFAQLNLISALQRERSAELVPVLTEFVTAEPENPSRRLLLGQALIDAGEPDAAAAALRRAVELKPELTPAHLHLGQALARLGKYDEAETQFRLVDEQMPHAPEGTYNIGIIMMYRGNPGAAVPRFQEALRRDRNYYPALLGLAHALHETGRTGPSRQAFVAVRSLSPDWLQIAVDRSWRMSTFWDPRALYAAESLRLARLAVAGGGPQEPGVLDVLAAALAENGQFEEAERTARRAAGIGRSGGHLAFAAEIEGRRALYARRQPYRQPAPASR